MDLEFQIAVQCDYLNKHRDLTFGGDKKISDYKIRYCHDCEKILPDIESCHKNKTQKLFHFLQFNHYGFDSLLYDGNTKMMVLFQIAIDRLHDLPYENLISFIEKKSENSFFKKYINFFGKLDQDDPQINRNGIGLGLSISNNLAKMLYNQNGYGSEGGIQVESEFGKGSTFFFMISGGSLEPENFSGTSEHKAIRTFTRLCQIEEGQNYKGLGQVIPEFPSEKKIISRLDIRVLIVEDDLINISVLELYLKFFGIAYLVAINGLNAVKIVEEEVIQKNNEISLILMDCNMPIMDGFKASEKIQEMLVRNKREDIPIVAATANTGKEDIEMCRNSGMKYYMEKPIQKKELGLFLQKMFKVSLNI